MWSYILRRVLYSIPIYLGIIFIVMAALRVNDPVNAYLGKNATQEQKELKRHSMGLDTPFLPVARYDPTFRVAPWAKLEWTRKTEDGGSEPSGIALYNPLSSQYVQFLRRIITLDFGSEERRYESWRYEGQNVGQKLRESVLPTVSITVPELILTTFISICVGLLSAYNRGSFLDRSLMFLVVLGMSISVVVFIVMGRYFGAVWLTKALGFELFASNGFEPGIGNWVKYCALPVLIGIILVMGYDTRFYRAVMVEEGTRDYITTALAKGAGKPKIMFVHMLKNAMIPIITRVMISVPFLIGGSIVIENEFRIPGMGKLLIESLINKDFPVIQTFTAAFAAVFLITNILTDVLYALVDPRVRLS